MRIFKIGIPIAIAILVSGCVTLDNKTILINNGDTKAQVLEIMGTPRDRQMKGEQEAWQYCVSGAGFGWNDHKIIWFQSGRVTGINSYRSNVSGCAGGIQPIRWESAPNAVIELRQR